MPRGGARQGAGRPKQSTYGKRMRKRKLNKKSLALMPHTFVERLPPSYLQVSPEVSAVGLLKNWRFADIPQVSSYVNIFEYYTINKVVVTFKYKNQGNAAVDLSAGGSGSQHINEANPSIFFKVDHDSDTLDPLATMKQSMRCHEVQLTNNKPNFSIQIKPACLIDTGNVKGAVGVDYRPKWGQMFSTDETGIDHHGLMMYAIGPNAISGTDYGQIQVDYKLYFTMRNNE